MTAAPTGRRALLLWLPEAAADLALRRAGAGGFGGAPLVLLADHKNARRIVGLCPAAEAAGLTHGLAAADARALRPDLASRPFDPAALEPFAETLRRWLGRYSPWISRAERSEGPLSDLSFALDVTGCAHLFGGEEELLQDLLSQLEQLGFRARAAIAGSKGAAWALARYGEANTLQIASPDALRSALADLPPAALRLSADIADQLARLGVRRIEDLAAIPRAALARRFGAPLCRRLDQAFGLEPEPIAPPPEPFHAAIRLALPEPIGLLDDLRAGLKRLLARMTERLENHGRGARKLLLMLRRVDGADQQLEIGLAAPSADPDQMLRLFEQGLESIEAGYGIDAMRLVAVETETRLPAQPSAFAGGVFPTGVSSNPALAELLSRIGGRFGFDRLRVMQPSESHAPEKAFFLRPAAAPEHAPTDWRSLAKARPPRPLLGFAPEKATILELGEERRPPVAFRWRGANHSCAAAFGPERIAPEWWLDDSAWRGGPRDYWRVETAAGARLWLFRLAQQEAPEWFVTGRFH